MITQRWLDNQVLLGYKSSKFVFIFFPLMTIKNDSDSQRQLVRFYMYIYTKVQQNDRWIPLLWFYMTKKKMILANSKLTTFLLQCNHGRNSAKVFLIWISALQNTKHKEGWLDSNDAVLCLINWFLCIHLKYDVSNVFAEHKESFKHNLWVKGNVNTETPKTIIIG